MQLILDSEPALAIERKMSAIGDVHNEKVGNGDTEKLDENNCNGNKENIADANIISNDEVNKQVVNSEVDASTDSAIETKSDNAEEDNRNGDVIKEQTNANNIPEAKDGNKEESQTNGISVEAEITDNIINESDTKAEEIVDEIAEDEAVVVEKEHLNKNLEDPEKVSETVANSVEMTVEANLPSAKKDTEIVEKPVEKQEECDTADLPGDKDDIEIVEQPAEKHKECDTPLDQDLEIQVNTPENKEKQLDDSNNEKLKPDCDPSTQDDMDVEEVVEPGNTKEIVVLKTDEISTAPARTNNVNKPIIVCKLSNTLDILSDDEDEAPPEPPRVVDATEKQCINIEDDDDIMLIDEDTNKTEKPQNVDISNKEETPISVNENVTNSETGEKISEEDLFAKTEDKELPKTEDGSDSIKINEKQEDSEPKLESDAPLIPENFFKTAKKNLSDMTRDELEEFCILKIVESIVDRSNLSEIKNRLKTVAQGIEEYRKKAMMLSKQNRDLQVVLKSIQEEQKKVSPETPITPLKITRSVGMQVYMEKSGARRKNVTQLQNPNNNSASNRQNAKTPGGPATSGRAPKTPAATQAIPVPRLVPASNNPAMKSPSTIPMVNQTTPTKAATAIPNGVKSPMPAQKVAEKRQHNRILSVTVDLTDDEPPTKVNNRTSPAPPVRVVPSQNLMASPRQPFASNSSLRKVYIPISGPQTQGLRPGQTIMVKTVPATGLRPRGPTPPVPRAAAGAVRMNRAQTGRHPAPLPDIMKQYQPPNWKALPPAPDLKLSKVENGIVISWKIEGYQEDSYEEIASYQLYAYQETSSPPSTALWKKIGDVKALPLPMACTLTQFMAGFKYYFAVRAVDIRSRLGPFSLPGSILLLNKL
nr:activating transcription factor 7-interacting protein 2 [Helicoverpa armigera]XP_021189323.2 activating transcription factor 7-interacting protein 2 [Helicoverpa armigera]XP_021189325.2 activating transcription factor 7-interacting protein 2 [Helicoverpa armigera]